MKIKLAYLNKDYKRSTGDKIMLKWYTVLVEVDHTKRYHAGMAIMARLGTLPRLLIDFICERMNSENLIENSTQFKHDFNQRIQGFKKKSMPLIA